MTVNFCWRPIADIGHELVFFDSHLCEETRQMVAGFPAVCVFVNDTLNAAVLQTLAAQGTRLIALRCAGFNNVDIQAASSLGLRVVRVPAYSPHSVAEHSVATDARAQPASSSGL